MSTPKEKQSMKSNKREMKAINEAFAHTMRKKRYEHWGLKPMLKSGKLPTQEQLWKVAATAVRSPNESEESVCSRLLRLLDTAGEAITLQKKCNEDYRAEQVSIAENEAKLPALKNLVFPMNLDDALKRIFPHLDTGERAEIFKIWLRQGFLNEGNSSPTADEIAGRFTNARQRPIDKQGFIRLRERLLFHRKNRIKSKRSEAAHSSWSAEAKKLRAENLEKKSKKP